MGERRAPLFVDVWKSLEAFEQFGNVLNEVAGELPGPLHVKLHRVHNVI